MWSKVLIAAAILLSCWSCQSPGERLSVELSSLREEVANAIEQPDEVEWQALMERRDELKAVFVEERASMTESEAEACNKALGAISGYEVKHSITGFGKGLKDAMQQAEGMVKTLQQGWREMTSDTISQPE